MSTTERIRRRIHQFFEWLPPETSRTGYLLRLSRPRFWLYLAGPVIVGAVYGANSFDELLSALPLALLVYFLVPANVFLYGVNDVFDADIDEENPKKENQEVRYVGGRLVPGMVLLTVILGLTFWTVLSEKAFVPMVAFLFLGTEYSAPPLRLKTTPFLDSLSNGLYVLPGVVAYVTLAGAYPPLAAVVGGWLWTMGMHTFSAIPDIEPDRAAGITTTATLLGERRTYVYCLVCWLAAAAAFSLVHPLFGLVLFAYPVLVFAISVADITTERAYWWYPVVNTVVGMILSLGGFWTLFYGR